MIYPPWAPLFVTTVGRHSSSDNWAANNLALGSMASGVWPSANLALYMPISFPFPYPAKRAWWVNGTTANGNVDLGLYSAVSGAKLYSTGATLQSGTSATQYVSVDWLVQPGEYFLALSLSSGTGTIFRTTGASAIVCRMAGVLQEASAHPLPTTMTPVTATNAYWPLFGLTRTTSGY